MSTVAMPIQEWRDIRWPKVEREVHTLQRRIYRASEEGDVKKVHRLQRMLMSSRSAKLLAVRRVTQDNQGKKTAGVDGISSLKPEERFELVENLILDVKPSPTRRVWIPKPGTDEQRPLGIPTIRDRALQALVKLALEPEWEAKFEPNSYGFRPGRSCQDAIQAIFAGVRYMPKYVLDADIAKCFDRINHEALLDKLNTFPLMRRLIKAWLKAGVLDGEALFPTEEGTPQGGVISPLLANIALHGMEEAITSQFPKAKRVNGQATPWKPTIIRYADDFVILHRELEVVQQCQVIAQEWLKGMGLELKPSKTRIAHTLEEVDGVIGFDFLGFTVRQFPAGKYRSRTNPKGQKLGFKTIIKPSKKKVKLHCQRLAEIVRTMRGATQADLIKRLNPVIRGWCRYYRSVAAKSTFHKLDEVTYQLLRSWVRWRHPHKSVGWRVRKYWLLPNWTFAVKDGPALARHETMKIVRHVKVKGTASPFNGEFAYWSSRMGHYPGISPWIARLLKQQKGKCPHCENYFMPDDLMEIHHRDGNHQNGAEKNLEVLHRHCHDFIHGPSCDSFEESVHEKD